MFKKKQIDNQNSAHLIAKVNDGFLNVTLTSATKPCVWRLELDKAKTAAFEITEGDEGLHALTIKAPRKALETIGSFKEQSDAFDALLAISDALNTSQTSAAPQISDEQAKLETSDAPSKKAKEKQEMKPQAVNSSNSNGLTVALLSTIIVFGLLYYFWSQVLPTTQVFETQVIQGTNIDPANQIGVPMSADDMLKGF